jgi:hypothetical protein
LRQEPVVPAADLSQPVVSDHKGVDLRWGQMIEAEGRHFRNAEFAAGEQPAMPGNYVIVAIDQDRDIKTKNPDTVGDLSDLLLAMDPRVPWVEL